MTFTPNNKFENFLILLQGLDRAIPRSTTPECIKFKEEFPADKLTSLALNRYCIGNNAGNSFCWWIEYGLKEVLGRYSPGTSKGHIIYFKKDGEVYEKHGKLRNFNDDDALQYTLKIQSCIANADISKDLSWIDDDEQLFKRAQVDPLVTIGDARKLRILICYHPDEFIPISSSKHLKYFLKFFGCPESDIPKDGQPVARSMLLRELFFMARIRIPELSPYDFAGGLYNADAEFSPGIDTIDDVDEGIEDIEIESSEEEWADPPMGINTIFYGPPGTGKTYATIDEAIKILDPEFYKKNESECESRLRRGSLKKRFDELVIQNRIRFVTFHQSFSYEDFVEGLRAETDESEGGQIKYVVEKGVFKAICEDAIKPIQIEADGLGVSDSPRIWKISIDGTYESATRQYCLKNGEARIGWGNVGDLKSAQLSDPAFKLGSNDRSTLELFSNEIAVGDVLLCIGSNTEVSAVGVVTGNYRYESEPPKSIRSDYKNVLPVNWIIADSHFSILNLNSQKRFTLKTVYEITRFSWSELLESLRAVSENLKACGYAQTNSNPFVLIIDEINRGNISRIFGELISLIEPSKRLGTKEALTVTLPYSKKPFGVPKNVHIIGTMNTADKSLTGLDIALRRRFVFKEMPVKLELLDKISFSGINIGQMLRVINQRIEVLLDRDHCIGHFYFLPLENDPSIARLSAIFKQQILPLLQEYFFEDWERIGWVLNDHRSKSERFIKLNADCDISLVTLFGSEVAGGLRDTRSFVNEIALARGDSYINIMGASE